MRLKAAQHRFLLSTIGGWTITRIVLLWPAVAPVAGVGTLVTAAALLGALERPIRFGIAPVFEPWRVTAPSPGPARPSPPLRSQTGVVTDMRWSEPDRAARLLLLTLGGGEAVAPQRLLRRPSLAREADAAPAPFAIPPSPAPATAKRRRLEGEAYLFVRPGSGRASLAAGGSLGGSQAAARIAYALNGTGPVRAAIAARLYAPLRTRGAEAALGLDWHPLPAVPLRLSVERRQRLDAAGRSAWSAYAAGGFYAGGLPRHVELDGYAQAGVVGARRRDQFVDGALRFGYRLGEAPIVPLIGAGLWGAAQPGVSRLDFGPRAAVRVPLADHMVSVALEGRMRVAGSARPGSGVALTIAADL